MKKLKKIFLNHLILRIINLLSLVFILCLIGFLAKGQEPFIVFIKKYKLSTILAFLILIAHLGIELKVAIEDYVPHLDRRTTLIKILWSSAMLAIALIGITIGKL